MTCGDLWAFLVDAPQMGVAAFLAGWVSGLGTGYVFARLVLR